jgi:cytochrome c553
MVKSEYLVIFLGTVFIAVTSPLSAKAPATISAKAKLQASQREGRRLFLEMSCMNCHSVAATGGSSAPALDGIGKRRTRAFIESKIRDPQAHPNFKVGKIKGKAKSRMIQADLFDDDIKHLTDYLMMLPARKQ